MKDSHYMSSQFLSYDKVIFSILLSRDIYAIIYGAEQDWKSEGL